mmetsp:Transcript_13903/g.41359  ORF Transcript_13903/g.41359 Transcript_13903/m.41359 type:complete len:228 (-) Transcript_13903:468-1151(-)
MCASRTAARSPAFTDTPCATRTDLGTSTEIVRKSSSLACSGRAIAGGGFASRVLNKAVAVSCAALAAAAARCATSCAACAKSMPSSSVIHRTVKSPQSAETKTTHAIRHTHCKSSASLSSSAHSAKASQTLASSAPAFSMRPNSGAPSAFQTIRLSIMIISRSDSSSADFLAAEGKSLALADTVLALADTIRKADATSRPRNSDRMRSRSAGSSPSWMKRSPAGLRT